MLKDDIEALGVMIADLKAEAETLKARMASFVPMIESLRTRAATELEAGASRDSVVEVLGQLEIIIQKMNATVN